MTTVDSFINSISSQLQSLQQTVSSAQSGSVSDPMRSFLAALSSFDAAASQTLSALSAGTVQGSANSTASTTTQTSSNSATLAASTMSALLAATSAGPSTSLTRATSGTARLLSAGSSPDTANKPGMAEFMAATGADASTASDVLYGTIGSNTDLRDWSAIMASTDPLGDARASTAAMYNSSLDYISPLAQTHANDVIAKSGNFAYANFSDQSPTNADVVQTSRLIIVDNQGNHLTTPGDPQSLMRRATNFGFDTSALSNLETQLDAAQVHFRTGAWLNGFF